MATLFWNSNEWKVADMGLITHRDTCLLEGVVGTINYWAPELFMGEANSKSSDCWALGIVFINTFSSFRSR
jgi:serine/threonine protein kinase